MSDERPHGFLTETHQKVLRGEFEGSDSTLRSHKSEIRKRAKAALADLTTVANSPHIDNESKVGGERLFEPTDLHALLSAVVEPGGLIPHTVEQPSEAFQNEVYVEIDRVLWEYRHSGEYGRDSQKEATSDRQTTCHNCGYEWKYGGDKSRATCPDCGRKTKAGQ